MHKYLVFVVLYLSGLTTIAQNADAVLDRYFTAIGGRDNWRKISTVHSNGVFVELTSLFNGNFKTDTSFFETHYKTPGKHKYHQRKGDDSFILYYNNDTLSTRINGEVTVQPPDHAFQYKAGVIPGIAAIFLNPETKVEYRGFQELNGRLFHVLEVERPGFLLAALYYFDPGSNYLVCIESVGAAFKGYTYLLNYRPVGDVVLPFREEVRRVETFNLGRERTESIALTYNAEINIPLSDSIFKP